MEQNKINRELQVLLEIDDNDIFRSEICHFLKRVGDTEFIKILLQNEWVDYFWDEEQYFKALYCIAILDYLASIYGIPFFPDYDHYRRNKFESPIYPKDIKMLSIVNPDEKIKEMALKECSESEAGPFFLRFNIVERSVRDIE